MHQCPPCSGTCNQGRQCAAPRQHFNPAILLRPQPVRDALLAIAIGIALAAVLAYS